MAKKKPAGKVARKTARAARKSSPAKEGAIQVVRKGVNFFDLKCEKGFHPETVIDKGIVTVHCVPNPPSRK